MVLSVAWLLRQQDLEDKNRKRVSLLLMSLSMNELSIFMTQHLAQGRIGKQRAYRGTNTPTYVTYVFVRKRNPS